MSRTIFVACGSRRPYVPAAALKDARAERDALGADLDRLRLAVNDYLLAQNTHGYGNGRDERRALCEVVYDLNVKAP